MVKNPPANAGDVRDAGSIPGSGSSPGEGHGNPLQYSGWRIPWTEECGELVCEVAESDMTEQLSMPACTSDTISPSS